MSDYSWPDTLFALRELLTGMRVVEHDCGATAALAITVDCKLVTREEKKVLAGRVLAGSSGREADTRVLSAEDIESALQARYSDRWGGRYMEFKVRSPLTCFALRGICALCWGGDPRTLALSDTGTDAGAVALGAFLAMPRAPFRSAPSFSMFMIPEVTPSPASGTLRYGPLPEGCRLINGRDHYGGGGPCVVFQDVEGGGIPWRLEIIGAGVAIEVRNEGRVLYDDGATVEKGAIVVRQLGGGHSPTPLRPEALGWLAELLEVPGPRVAYREQLERLQTPLEDSGIEIDARCVEMVLREMNRWERVVHPGESGLGNNDLVDRNERRAMNDRLAEQGRARALVQGCLFGLSEALEARREMAQRDGR